MSKVENIRLSKKPLTPEKRSALRSLIQSTVRDDWWCGVRGADNTQARIFEHPGRIDPGTYFLCDLEGNTIDLCKATRRKFRNKSGRLVAAKVIETIVPDCHGKFGTALNGCWIIPFNLI